MFYDRLAKGIFLIFLANVTCLLINLVSNYILPRYLSIDAYADIKTFQLFTAYVGVLSFGYVDGVYLKYGGKALSLVDKNEFRRITSTFRLSQILLTVLLVFFCFFYRNKILFFSILAISVLNMPAYIKTVYQATGQFNHYSIAVFVSGILVFLFNLYFVFIAKETGNATKFLVSYLLVDLILWFYLEFELSYRFNLKPCFFVFDTKLFLSLSSTGFFLLLGNSSSILLTSIDRFFVKIFFQTYDFALFAFAVSIESFLNTAMTPITITLYNFFCKTKDTQVINHLFVLVELFAAYLISLAFIAVYFVGRFLPQYIESSKTIFILFSAQLFFFIVKAIFVNLYKANNNQKIYFNKLMLVVLFSFTAICFGLLVFSNIESIAFTTLFSALFWFIISLFDFKNYFSCIKKISYPFFCVFSFLLISFLFSPVYGFLLYLTFLTLFTFFLFRTELSFLLFNFLKNNSVLSSQLNHLFRRS